MEEKVFYDWCLRGGDDDIWEWCRDYVGEYDADEVAEEFVEHLEYVHNTDFRFSAGVERIVVWQPEWEHVYKFRVTCIGSDFDDFERICDLAKDCGISQLFLEEEYITEIEGMRVTRQKKALGNKASESDSTYKMYYQLPHETKSKVDNTRCEYFLAWVYTLYGEEFGDAVCEFCEENEICDIHTSNFTVFGNTLQVYDAAIAA